MLTFSNSHLWSNCAASVHPHPAPVPLVVEAERSDERLEGEAAAWVANQVLRGDAASVQEMLGEMAPNGWPIDAEMMRHVGRYVEIVTRHGRATSECELSLWGGSVRGRPDSYSVEREDVLHIYDLKYGYRIVEPHGNSQLLLAAIALAQQHHRLFSLEIFQPRAAHANGPLRKWVVDADELNRWTGTLYDAMRATFEERPVATVGAQCDFCPRRAACHALASAVYDDAEKVRSNHRARALNAQELSDEIRFLDAAWQRLKARRDGIRAELDARVLGGEFVPGQMLDPRHGNRTWIADAAKIQMLTGIDPRKSGMKSPAELEKEGADPTIVAMLCKRPFAGMQVVPWDAKKVGRIFGDD